MRYLLNKFNVKSLLEVRTKIMKDLNTTFPKCGTIHFF